MARNPAIEIGACTSGKKCKIRNPQSPALSTLDGHILKMNSSPLAALEMAAGGVGVAWVPASVARPQIANARIVDMSHILPSCALLVKAVRLVGKPGPAETALWSQLIEMGKPVP